MGNEVTIWNYLTGRGLSDYAAAGVMGNLYAESGLIPNNLQNIYNASLGMSDEEYTRAVDNGSYSNFVRDMAGYGLAQWTFWSRKQGLLDLAKKNGRSIADLMTQLEFLCDELQEFGLWGRLNACGSVREASKLILNEYEKPADTGTAVQNARAGWSQEFYNKYHGTASVTIPDPVPGQVSDRGFMVVAYRKYSDQAAAEAQLAALKAGGMDGMVILTAE